MTTRFRFQAVDEKGRVVRGVMRAESEQQARETLLGDHVYAKRLEPAGDDEAVTWGPKRGVAERLENHRREVMGGRPRPRRALFATEVVAGMPPQTVGQAGLDDAGRFVFASPAGPVLEAGPEQIEAARACGFPRRLLQITMLDGHIYEFTAGWFLTATAPREVLRALNTPCKEKS